MKWKTYTFCNKAIDFRFGVFLNGVSLCRKLAWNLTITTWRTLQPATSRVSVLINLLYAKGGSWTVDIKTKPTRRQLATCQLLSQYLTSFQCADKVNTIPCLNLKVTSSQNGCCSWTPQPHALKWWTSTSTDKPFGKDTPTRSKGSGKIFQVLHHESGPSHCSVKTWRENKMPIPSFKYWCWLGKKLCNRFDLNVIGKHGILIVVSHFNHSSIWPSKTMQKS